jgi:hypothetical protein
MTYSARVLFGHEEAGMWVTVTGLQLARRQDRVKQNAIPV